jgi:hypothetical protein
MSSIGRTTMISLLLLPTAIAAPPWIDHYACRQTNPIPGADFELFFAVDTRPLGAVVPTAVRLDDLETSTVRMVSTEPSRARDMDLGGPRRDAWLFGEDDIAQYFLLVPHRELREIERSVTVTEVFGGGQAQWVNEFSCELL